MLISLNQREEVFIKYRKIGVLTYKPQVHHIDQIAFLDARESH